MHYLPATAQCCAATLLAALALLFSSGAAADPFHYRNLLVGERASGFGGAYVALSDDTSGLFHNPAGTVHSQELASASVNVLRVSRVEYEDFFPDASPLESTSQGLVPSFFGILRHTGAYTLGLSIAVTDYLSERQLDRAQFVTGGAELDEYIAGDSDYRNYYAGPTLAGRFGGGWSWGVTLYGSYRDLREARSLGGEAIRAGTEAGTTEHLSVLTSYRIEDTQLGVRPLLGVQYRDARMGLGLTVSRDFGLSREYDYFYRTVRVLSLQQSDGSESPLTSLDVAADSTSSQRQDQPWHVALGGSATLGARWRLAAQLDHYFAVRQSVEPGADASSPPVTRQFETTTNLAAGFEYQLTDRASLRLAAFTDTANSEVHSSAAFQRVEQIDLLGVSLGGSYRDAVREYKAGLYVSAGDGHGTLGDLGELDFSGKSVVDASSTNLVLFFGAEL